MKALIFGILIGLSINPAFAQGTTSTTIWTPNVYASQSGNANGISSPFVMPYGQSYRMQQVVASSQFSAIPQGGLISGMVFRLPVRGITEGVSSRVEMEMSTTAAQPGSLSPTFALNLGPDTKTVFAQGRLDMTQTNGLFKVKFSSPFFYNPVNGNLLLDVRNYTGNDEWFLPETEGLQAQNTEGQLASMASAANANATAATWLSATSFIIGFEVTPVPEASSLILLGAGLVALFTAHQSRKQANCQ